MHMKKWITVVSWLILSATACTKEGSFLDKKETTDLNEQTVFADSARTMDFLTGIYADAGFSWSPNRFSGNAGLEACSDEASGPVTGGTYLQFVTGSVSAFSIPRNSWDIPYENIRRVNIFLKHLPGVRFDPALKERAKGEALFLRAWYYAILLKHYGGVPIVGDTVYNAKDKINTVRNTYGECVSYIVAACDSAAVYCPAQYSSLDYGRATMGACLALKARVLLYAASDLFNGGFPEQPGLDATLRSIVSYPDQRNDRWKLAADAARQVIASGLYQLVEDNDTRPGYGFYNLFQLRKNNEAIFQLMKPPNKELEGYWIPPSRGGTAEGAYAYQDMVDAFGMINGKPITDTSYDPAHPYNNRDPRLDYTIIRNGSMTARAAFGLQPVYTYVNDNTTGDQTGVGTPTGYYINKMLDVNVAGNNLTQTPRCPPLMRYAEVLLNFAEAENEFSGPGAEVYQAILSIRKRAGIMPGADGMYGLPAGMGKEEMREMIRRERRVELAFEEHRFWDVRRWKIAPQTDNKAMSGMRVNRVADGYTYQAFTVRQHVFRAPIYLFPIPQQETGKSADLLQNPGW